MRDFIQDGPALKNQYETDHLLRTFLRWRLPAKMQLEIEPGLLSFGGRVVADVYEMGEKAEACVPKHIPYSAWGKRIDKIETSEYWDQLQRVAAEEGLIAIGYERTHGEYSRLHQLTKLYLFHPSSAFFSCPLAMTDGAARAIELYGDDSLKNKALKNLTSRNPQRFWTSGQWMTERTGGSDVSETSTVAKLVDGHYGLWGDKWFTSATTSQMTMTLARIEGDPQGSKGLSLFYVELRDNSGNLRNIRVNRLKDKLGTKALPTAELTLDGAPAVLVGGQGGGVKKIASVLNITRMYNSICALSSIARALALAKDYARKRMAFGRTLAEQPLHMQTLSDLQVEFEGCFHLTFHLSHLLGKEETGKATPSEAAILRLLTPVVKLWTAKKAVEVASETLECFGGAGYIEDTGLPRLLRDAQVFSIWEGTTNVLSLDVLRAIAKEGALEPFFADLATRLANVKSETLAPEVAKVKKAAEEMRSFFKNVSGEGEEFQLAAARGLAYTLAHTYAAGLLLEFADWCNLQKQRASSEEVAKRWCARHLVQLIKPNEAYRQATEKIVWG